MSRPIHLIGSPIVPGYGLSDGKYLPCTGVSGSIISISSSSSFSNYNSFQHLKNMSLTCTSRNSSIFSSNSGIYRRNPNSHRQNKHTFSQFHNTQNEDNESSSEDLDEPEDFSSRNGSLIYSKSQPRSAMGPKEKEVIALFRKVQAQLRAKAIDKQEKIEGSSKPMKESNNAVSLLKILRKYTVPQIDRTSGSGNLKDGVEKREPLSASSLISGFRPRSLPPHVPEVNETVDSDEREREPMILNRAIFEEISDEETFVSDEEDSEDDDDDDDGGEQNNMMMIGGEDLSIMKLTELRALAKSRGIKGFSKMKKSDLAELLSGGSV